VQQAGVAKPDKAAHTKEMNGRQGDEVGKQEHCSFA
jgi:hypothetical protein